MKMTLVSVVFKDETVSLFVIHKKGEKVSQEVIESITKSLHIQRGQTYGVY